MKGFLLLMHLNMRDYTFGTQGLHAIDVCAEVRIKLVLVQLAIHNLFYNDAL